MKHETVKLGKVTPTLKCKHIIPKEQAQSDEESCAVVCNACRHALAHGGDGTDHAGKDAARQDGEVREAHKEEADDQQADNDEAALWERVKDRYFDWS